MSKHTPGPWKVENEEPYGQGDWGGWAIKGPYGRITTIGCANQRGPIDIETNQANAHLIAAAPDMYEALKAAEEAIVNCHTYVGHIHYEQLNVVRAALAKARGET